MAVEPREDWREPASLDAGPEQFNFGYFAALCIVLWGVVYTVIAWSKVASDLHWVLASLLAVGAAMFLWEHIQIYVRRIVSPILLI